MDFLLTLIDNPDVHLIETFPFNICNFLTAHQFDLYEETIEQYIYLSLEEYNDFFSNDPNL
jgi:hypothetical protein